MEKSKRFFGPIRVKVLPGVGRIVPSGNNTGFYVCDYLLVYTFLGMIINSVTLYGLTNFQAKELGLKTENRKP